jgi:nucleoside 2-deoxyribosyltransferase
MKRAYLGFKFYDDMRNRELIEQCDEVFKKLGMETSIIVRDFEVFGDKKYESHVLMTKTFEEIDASDVVVIEFSEKGVGLGIEAGYAAGTKKPVWVIAKTGSEISNTLAGTAERVVFYNKPEDLLSLLS